MSKILSAKRGAMFGLDARITLAIATIIALIVGLNQLKSVERYRIEETRQKLSRLKAAAYRYYEANKLLPSSSADLLNNDAQGSPFANDSDVFDAWGNTYYFLQVSGAGSTPSIPAGSHSLYIISPGADETFNHDYSNEEGKGMDELPGNVLLEELIASVGDDLATRVSTYQMDLDTDAQGYRQLEEIRRKLEALAAHNKIRWQRECEASGTGTSGCDYNADGTYIKGEELSANFFPQATEVVAGCAASRPFYADGYFYSSRSYTSGDLASMQSLLTALGLPTHYATHRRVENVLKYDSNVDNRCAGPFSFKVYYF